MRFFKVGAIITGVFLVLFIVWLLLFTTRVPEGKVAVVYSPSKGASEILNPGWHTIGITENTIEYPIRIQTIKSKTTTTTSDSKKIDVTLRYEMKVDKAKVLKIFKELGSQDLEQIQEGYLYTKLFKAARDNVSQYSLLDVYGSKTTEISGKVTKDFSELVSGLGFIITDVTLGAPEPDPVTQKAIDDRVKASQLLEQKKIDIQIATKEAERKKIEAQGNADVAIENAEGQAKSNRLLQQSITPELIRLKEADARLKHGWVEVQTGQAIVDAK